MDSIIMNFARPVLRLRSLLRTLLRGREKMLARLASLRSKVGST